MKEELIKEMYKCMELYGNTDYRTVALSQKLDLIILKEQKAMMEVMK